MSLKTLHIIFISLSILLCAGLAFMMFGGYAQGLNSWAILIGSCAIAAAIALVWYGIYFLKKLRHVHFL